MIHKWLVIGPGRTGSKVIVNYIRSYYRGKLKYIDPSHTSIPLDDENFWIFHSHDVNIYKQLMDSSVNLIASTRDPVDSALSWCILNRTKIWHQYPGEKFITINIEPFVLSVEDLDRNYCLIVNFYEELKKCLNNKTTIIDYSQFENNNEKLADILKMKVAQPFLPLKNTDIWQWIINRSEVESKIKDYTRSIPL